jgi:ribosomal 50S subunit-associated protein YjgA (DUF615 family)
LPTCFQKNFAKKKSFLPKKIIFEDFGAFLRHFDFTTIIDNFSTFFRRYFQPQKYFKKVENLRICRPVFEIFLQKKSFLPKKIVFEDFGAFLRHFDFRTIIDNFSTFFRRYVQPQKYFKKVENLRICRPVFEFFLQKKSVLPKK